MKIKIEKDPIVWVFMVILILIILGYFVFPASSWVFTIIFGVLLIIIGLTAFLKTDFMYSRQFGIRNFYRIILQKSPPKYPPLLARIYLKIMGFILIIGGVVLFFL